MPVEADLVAHLEGQSWIADQVDDRIYPSVRPQESTVPAIVYQRIATPRRHTHDGPAGLANPTFQWTCWAATYGAAIALAQEVRFALDGYRGQMGDTYVSGIFVVSEIDDRDEDTGYWRRIIDSVVWHRELVS